MALLEWNSNYSVGVPEFDEEHKELVEMINSLHDAMKSGKGKELMPKLLDEVTEYALQHFAHEEKLMVKYNYPQYKEHKIVHDDFKRKIVELRKLHDQKILQASQLLNALQEWLINHICNVDKQYGLFFTDTMKK